MEHNECPVVVQDSWPERTPRHFELRQRPAQGGSIKVRRTKREIKLHSGVAGLRFQGGHEGQGHRCLGAPLKDSRRRCDFLMKVPLTDMKVPFTDMEVPFAKDKWPCPFKNKI